MSLETQVIGPSTTQEVARSKRWLCGIGAVLYSWIVAGFGSFSDGSYIAIVGTGLLVLVVGFVCPMSPAPIRGRLTKVGVIAWFVILGVFSAQELTNFFWGSPPTHPTLTSLLDPVFEDHFYRSIGVFLWIRVGWALMHR